MKHETFARYVWLAVSLVILLIVAGAWFNTDPNATLLGKYTARSLLKLVIITLGGYFGIALLRFLLLPQAIVSNGMQRSIPVCRKALITVFAVLAVFAGVEGMLQWKLQKSLDTETVRRQELTDDYDPFHQAVPRPGDELLHINRWGFRGEDIEKTKPPNTYRIFAVGGSTVYSSEVDFEHSHVRILEKLLRQRYPHLKIEIQNAGMHWHTTQHSLMKILFNIQDFEPDMIIIFHAINDLFRSFSPEKFALGPYRSDYGHFPGPVMPIVREYFEEKHADGLLIPGRIHEFFTLHWFSDFRDIPGSDAYGIHEVTVDDWPSHASFERNMQNIVAIVKALDMDLVMASQPYLYRDDLNNIERDSLWIRRDICRIGPARADLPSMIRGMEKFNATSRRIAASHGVLYVDLEQQVPKSLDYLMDDVHFTEQGNSVIGHHFAEQIIANGYITRKFPEPSAARPAPSAHE